MSLQDGSATLSASHLAKLHSTFDRDFVIGIADNITGVAEDLFLVESDAPDLDRLRSTIGVRGS